jgi:hypothetical protein
VALSSCYPPCALPTVALSSCCPPPAPLFSVSFSAHAFCYKCCHPNTQPVRPVNSWASLAPHVSASTSPSPSAARLLDLVTLCPSARASRIVWPKLCPHRRDICRLLSCASYCGLCHRTLCALETAGTTGSMVVVPVGNHNAAEKVVTKSLIGAHTQRERHTHNAVLCSVLVTASQQAPDPPPAAPAACAGWLSSTDS